MAFEHYSQHGVKTEALHYYFGILILNLPRTLRRFLTALQILKLKNTKATKGTIPVINSLELF